jgi:hypothetical protein
MVGRLDGLRVSHHVCPYWREVVGNENVIDAKNGAFGVKRRLGQP